MADEAFAAIFPNGMGGGRNASGTAIVGSYPLGPEHLVKLAAHVEGGAALGVTPESREKMSRTHHRLAQFLAMGMDEGQAGVLCNYGPATVSILKSDPLFQELVEYYASQVDAEFASVAEQMADLHEDTVVELRKRLEDSPQQFTVTSLTELMKALADRTGNGPTSNVNARVVSVSLTGHDLQRIKGAAPAGASDADRPTGVLSAPDIAALEGVFKVSAADVAGPAPAQREPAGQGPCLRAEDDQDADDAMGANAGVALP